MLDIVRGASKGTVLCVLCPKATFRDFFKRSVRVDRRRKCVVVVVVGLAHKRELNEGSPEAGNAGSRPRPVGYGPLSV